MRYRSRHINLILAIRIGLYLRLGEYWGEKDIIAWFRTKIKIPKNWKNDRIELKLVMDEEKQGIRVRRNLYYI